jgi:hypothetical protein
MVWKKLHFLLEAGDLQGYRPWMPFCFAPFFLLMIRAEIPANHLGVQLWL